MGKSDPIFGIDVASYQQGINMKQAAAEGHKFCLVKATEGPYRDGSLYVNPEYDAQITQARNNGMVVGAYHFLVETNPKAQAEAFLNKVRDGKQKILVVDFEAYAPPYGALTPSNETLRRFIKQLKMRIEADRPIVIYSSRGFWNGGTPSGNVDDYGTNLHTWDALYRDMDLHPDPKAYYKAVQKYGWGKTWGGREPMFWQFTSTGRVAGRNMDVNAFRGTMNDLRFFAHGTPGTVPVKPKPTPETPSLVPPGFVPKPVRNGNYTDRHPTRYEYEPPVADLARRLYAKFRSQIHINTYVEHPGDEGGKWARDTAAFDVWGPGGRGDPIDFNLGQQVFNYIYNDPSPPYIDWIIWNRVIRTRASGFAPVQFGFDDFTWHIDHIHVTFTGNYRLLR